MAKIPVFQLRTVGVSIKGITIVKAVRVYKFLVQPRWKYAMHLTPRRVIISAAIEELQNAFFAQVFCAIRRNRAHRLRVLLWIDLTKNRIQVLALRIPKRAQKRKKEILSEV